MTTKQIRTRLGIVALALATAPAPARAQSDSEVPVLVLDVEQTDEVQDDYSDLDLANVVVSAAKYTTTVQQAPSIISVIPGEELRARGDSNFIDAMDQIPGWLPIDAVNYNVPYVLVRGTLQAVLIMEDGVSLFDPTFNFTDTGRVVPLELVDRVEAVTGPAGVLWGANSYLGVANVITRDASDIDGVETGVDLGTGPGDPNRLRVYALGGFVDVLGTGVDAVAHASFETYSQREMVRPRGVFLSTAPSPPAPTLYRSGVEASGDPSTIVLASGSLTKGPVSLKVSAPMVHHRPELAINGMVNSDALPEDEDPACTAVAPFLPDGSPNPEAMRADDTCVDRGQLGRDHEKQFFTRYATVKYEDRLANQRLGLSARAYAVQFVRRFRPMRVMPASDLIEGGVAVDLDATSYRGGAAVDANWEIGRTGMLLVGGEVFREWLPDSTTDSQQGPGVQSTFRGPYDLSRLNLPCPERPNPDAAGGTEFVAHCPLTFMFATDRTVMGAYVNPQLHITKKLTLDVGARLQAAPAAFGKASYAPQLLLSGAAVYRLPRDWNLKLNYAEGFRPPVFNNTDSNGEAIQIGGNPDIEVETSQGTQVELNARLLRGTSRRVRELAVRMDYSYTRLNNLIQVRNMQYVNAGTRGIHSAEALAKLHIRGGHQVQVGYTWLHISFGDEGRSRTMPEHWFHLTGVFQLMPESLQLSSTMRVIGAMEDPNNVIDPGAIMPGETLSVTATDVVLDRVPPSADLQVGLTYVRPSGLRVRAFAYNVLNAQRFQPVALEGYDVQAPLSNTYPGFRFMLSASHTY